MSSWLAPLSAFVFISVALKSCVVLGAAGLIARFLRRRSAAARHLVWTAAFIALSALPFFSIAMPSWRVPLPSGVARAEAVFQTVSVKPADLSNPLHAQARSAPIPTNTERAFDWRVALFFLWCAGTIVSLGRMLAAFAALRSIQRRGRPVMIRNFRSMAECLGIRRRVDVFEIERGKMPMNFGLFRQAIFLPSDLLDDDEERSRLVTLHELAHVKRCDAVVHVLVRAILSVYWWNPLAWFAWREFLNERERAADDLVLNAGARPSEYANCLLEIAAAMQSPTILHSGAVAMARCSDLEDRLTDILESRNRRGVRPLGILSGSILAIVIAAPLAALRPQDHSPQTPPADPAAAIRLASERHNPEMLDEAAKAAEELRNYDLARQLLDSALALRGQLSGRQSQSYGIGLLQLADFERERGKFNDARPLYDKALPLLGNTSEGATALIHMGAMALVDKNTREAIDDFTRAQGLNSADAGRGDMWIALAQEREGFAEQADASFQSALRKSEQNSALAATIMEVYAQFLVRQGRASEAKPLLDKSAAIRKALGEQPVPAAQSIDAKIYRIGGDVTAPVLLSKVEPEYSQDARAAKYQGTVLLSVEIGTDGLAHNVKVSHGLGLGLNEKATQAVSLWKFKPSTKEGQPVAVEAQIEVNFRLL